MGSNGRRAALACVVLQATLSSAVWGCGGSAPPPSETAASDRAQLAKVERTLSFTGPDGVRVEAVDLADGSAFVRVQGTDSPLVAKVLAYERALEGERLEYRTTWHGRPLYALVKERDGGWRAYLPGARSALDLTYSEPKSAEVDAEAILRQHLTQKQRGELAALQRFDRAAEQRGEDEALAEATARANETCGGKLGYTIDWSSVRDAQLLEKSVSGYCESLLDALRHLCDDEVGKQFARSLREASCKLDGDDRLTLDEGKLRWAIDFEITNAAEKAYGALLAMTPPGSERTLGAQILGERTAVCADPERKHVVLLGPREAPHGGMAYGDGERFFLVRTDPMLGESWFLDPRQRNDKHNDDFRGRDLRMYSYVEADAAHGTCKVSCGTRETALRLVTGDEKSAILARARYEPSPHQREPYALARDKTGTYYFVDHGVTEASARDFHLYRGKRGKLRRLQMKDVVSDSEGEIFASASGSLRLVLGKDSAQWVSGGTTNLLLLPLHENLGLIYNELGVYLTERLGVPCDDF